jgi:hypothetical protein
MEMVLGRRQSGSRDCNLVAVFPTASQILHPFSFIPSPIYGLGSASIIFFASVAWGEAE